MATLKKWMRTAGRLMGMGGAKPSPRRANAKLVSFPKSGRTWLRLMIGRALQQHFQLQASDIERKMFELTSLGDLDARVPKVEIYHDDDPQWKTPGELEGSKERYADERVILLVRDPRDVMISNYYEVRNRVVQYANDMRPWVSKLYGEQVGARVKPYEGDLDQWLKESWGSLATIIAYYNIWAEAGDVPKGLLLVRYEDLHAQGAVELQRILTFLGVECVDEKVIEEAVAYASFDQMRAMEKKDVFKHNALRPVDPNNPDTFKTRKGKVGGFEEHLNDQQAAYVADYLQRNLSSYYGYP